MSNIPKMGHLPTPDETNPILRVWNDIGNSGWLEICSLKFSGYTIDPIDPTQHDLQIL